MKEIFKQLSPAIRALGFKGTGQNYYQACEDVVLVINFQKSSGGMGFYINLGGHPNVLLAQKNAKQVKEYQCMFGQRIFPENSDGLWPYQLSEAEIEYIQQKIKLDHQEFFMPLSAIKSHVMNNEATVLVSEKMHGSIYGFNQAGYCEKYAFLAQAYGQIDKAKALTLQGIKLSPSTAPGMVERLEKFVAGLS